MKIEQLREGKKGRVREDRRRKRERRRRNFIKLREERISRIKQADVNWKYAQGEAVGSHCDKITVFSLMPTKELRVIYRRHHLSSEYSYRVMAKGRIRGKGTCFFNRTWKERKSI